MFHQGEDKAEESFSVIPSGAFDYSCHKEHTMRGLEPCEMRLLNTCCCYAMIAVTQPASFLLPALTPRCTTLSIYCTAPVPLEKFLHPTEKMGRTPRDYSAIPRVPAVPVTPWICPQEFRILVSSCTGYSPGALLPGAAGDSAGSKFTGPLQDMYCSFSF